MAQSEKSSVVINRYTEDVYKKLQTFLENEIRNEGIDKDVSKNLNTCEKFEVYERIKTFLVRLEEDAESDEVNEEDDERLKAFLENDAGSKGVKDDVYRRIKNFLEEDTKCETEYENVYEKLKTCLEVDAGNGANENMGFSVNPNDVDLDKSDYENLVEKIKKAKHTISVVTKKSVDNFFKDEEHYQVWLRALHKALDDDNVLSHIIFCVDVDVEKVTWYLRQFNPCIKYSSENDDWKKELLAVLKLGKKSVKTLKHVNAGEALAWSHYTGYVSFLQNIGAGGDPKDESVWRAENGKPVINELVMVVPKDCHCPDKIEHPLIEGPYQSEKYSFHRAGKERKLNADLYKLSGIDKLVPIACTPSIDTLRLLKEEKDLDEKWLQDQRKRYIAVLKERIKNNEYLKRKVILIDEDDKDDLVNVILRRIEKACQNQQKTASNPENKDAKKQLSVYLRSNEDDDRLAEKIQCTIQKAIPNLNIVNTHHRVVGALAHSESLKKIEEADQCIFLLTDHKEKVSAINEVCTCLDKVRECDNKRATILLYTKEAREVQQEIFKLLAKHFVAKVQYDKDGWEKKLMEAITDIQARPLQSAVNFHNISEGLAFGYLYGYLKLFLPEFSKELERVKKFPEFSNVMPKKIIILMPKSGYSPTTLQATDDTHLKELKEKRITGKIKYRVGCQERDFSATEYSLKDEDGTEYFVAAEFLTPLRALTEMRNDIFADMSYKQKRDQQRNLRKVMLEIQKSGLIPKEVEDKFLLLEIEDEEVDEKGKPKMIMTDADKLKLYHRELLKTVKEELRRERGNPEEQVAQQMGKMDIQ